MGKVIKFNNDVAKRKRALETLNLLMEHYEGDFYVVFESKGFEDIFDYNVEAAKEYLVATTNKEFLPGTRNKCILFLDK